MFSFTRLACIDSIIFDDWNRIALNYSKGMGGIILSYFNGIQLNYSIIFGYLSDKG